MEVKAAIIETDITNKEKLAAMRIHQAKVKRDLLLAEAEDNAESGAHLV
jgi:hypothetical protein